MSKSKNKQTAGPQIKNPQAFERLRFLHQAAVLMSSIRYDSKATVKQQSKENNKKRRRGAKEIKVDKWSGDPKGSLLPVSRYLNSNMKQITARMVLRLDPNVKRMVCKRCDTPLIPALTSSMRIQSNPVATAVQTCQICSAKKRYTTQKPDYELFNDRQDIAKASIEEEKAKESESTTVEKENSKSTQNVDRMEICT